MNSAFFRVGTQWLAFNRRKVIEDFTNASQIMLESHEYCLRMKDFFLSFLFGCHAARIECQFFSDSLQYQMLETHTHTHTKFKFIAFASILTGLHALPLFWHCCFPFIPFSMWCLSLLFKWKFSGRGCALSLSLFCMCTLSKNDRKGASYKFILSWIFPVILYIINTFCAFTFGWLAGWLSFCHSR